MRTAFSAWLGSSFCIGTALAAAVAFPACGPNVDCETLCHKTLSCEVTFAPADDPALRLVDDGTRTPLASCAIGCRDADNVDEESAACANAVDDDDAFVCQEKIVQCFDSAATATTD